MTEVMVHTSVDSSYFPESKFNHLKKSKKTEMTSVEISEFKENYVHKDTSSENNSENMNCKSDKEVPAVKNAHTSDMNDLKDNKMLGDKIQDDTASGEDYKILTTKTTVINTTYNLITQSTTREVTNVTNNVEKASWSNFSERMNEAVDKSRVIVQVLKSDHKSKMQDVVEAKTPSSEHPVTHNFRDDLCKLLTKSSSRLPKFDEDSTTEDSFMTDASNSGDTSQNIPSQKSDIKTHVPKARRKRNLNLYFLNGNGLKISDLKCVYDNLRQATPGTLRYLHYIMFNSFGLCGSGLKMLETKKNIAGFCGYPFKRSSEQFKKKFSCLKKIPEQLLMGIHRAVFGKTSFFDRSVMVDQLLDFLLVPRKCNEILKKYESKSMDIPEELYTALKESALKGPVVSIVLDKLSEEQIKNYSTKCVNRKYEMELDHFGKSEDKKDDIQNENKPVTIPAFILNGPGTKLKYFSKIAHNVRIIPEKSVKMFHYILYGRIGSSIEDCRRNILEFNGFSKCQQEFSAERKAVIKGLNQRELFELCQILCLHAKTNSREVRIKKILKYLHSPSKPIRARTCFKPKGNLWAVSSRKVKEGFFPKRKYTKRFQRKTDTEFFKSSEFNFEKQDSILTPSVPPDYPDEIFSNEGTRLRDFKTIRSNIECAAPSDLIELNDLLFMRTCDESDIHQKILDCTKFKFPINSFQYDCRKTLMHYMGFHVLRKIAGLLDIENLDKISNPVDLSSNILKFLMEGKAKKPCLKSSNHTKPFEEGIHPENSSPSSSEPSLKSSNHTKPFKEGIHPENSSPSSSEPSLKSSNHTKPFEEGIHPENSSPSSSSQILESNCIVNDESPEKIKPECVQQTNQAVVPYSNNVIIQRLTKAPVQMQEVCQSDFNKSIQMEDEQSDVESACANYLEDDSLCLRELIHHPSEQELNELIHRIVKGNLWDYTLGDLVQNVYECYPKVNLTYRESFIKAAARQVISEWRDYAVSAVTDQSFL